MARKVHSIVAAVECNPILRALPLASQMLWVRLAVAFERAGLSALRVGSAAPNPHQLAVIAGVSEPDLETYLEPIIAAGLLCREADGALALPIERGSSSRRAEASRANGLKGGRPRQRAPGARPAQAEMMMPIGGGGRDKITQSAPLGSTAKLSLEAKKAKQAAPDADVERIGRAALAEAGLSPDGKFHIVRSWLSEGASEQLILETIQAKTRPGVGHLGYFKNAIREAMERPGAAYDVLSAKSRAFTRATEEWQAFGRRGPQPAPDWFAADGSRRAA